MESLFSDNAMFNYIIIALVYTLFMCAVYVVVQIERQNQETLKEIKKLQDENKEQSSQKNP